MKRFFTHQNGSSTLLIAMLMLVMLMFTALIIDGGQLLLSKNSLQRAVDAAALAGALDLPIHTNDAALAAKKTAEFNELPPEQTDVIFSNENRMVTVTGSRIEPFFFAQAFGLSAMELHAEATVQLSPLSLGIGAVPLGVEHTTTLSYGTRISLKVADATVGNFGALALTGPGARNYETDLKEGYQFVLKVGDILDTQTGNISGPTQRAVEARIAQCPGATYMDYPLDCGRAVLVPVYSNVLIDQNQVKQVKVLGFATFFIESVLSTNQGSEVIGRFIQTVTSGDGSINESAHSDYGTYNAKLVK